MTYICCAIVGIVLAMGIYILILQPAENTNAFVDITDNVPVSKICELATLKCFYHNNGVFEKKEEGLFQYGLAARYGYKKLFIEYDGIVVYGIDAGQVKISNPNSDGIVDVYVPDAGILSINAINSTLKDNIEDTGWFTTITPDERSKTFLTAQSKMEEQAQNDEHMLIKAKENAKTLISQYIIEVGKTIGKDYSVKWIDNINDIT